MVPTFDSQPPTSVHHLSSSLPLVLQKDFRESRAKLRQRLEAQVRKNVASGFPEGLSECGTDAVRMYLSSAMIQTRAIPVNPRDVRAWRHFCNKLWQATRFVALQATEAASVVGRQRALRLQNLVDPQQSPGRDQGLGEWPWMTVCCALATGDRRGRTVLFVVLCFGVCEQFCGFKLGCCGWFGT